MKDEPVTDNDVTKTVSYNSEITLDEMDKTDMDLKAEGNVTFDTMKLAE